ncbi:hypothetical protein [Meiothermus rufus]|uniref:hypothetical protein n=1 Tax=Meiothermus rufus TaxID=604332 RepID=UPI0003FF539B|nr:hypothetical protein [Meiothermus rufus]
MKPLLEAIRTLQAQELLEGSLALESEVVQLWVYRQAAGFDLYLACGAQTQPQAFVGPFRTTIGRNLASVEEVLEVLHHLDLFYCIEPGQLLQLPVSAQPATPELVAAIEQRFKQEDAAPQESQEENIEVVLEEPEEDIQHLLLTDT